MLPEASRPASVSTVLALDEIRDLVCAPAGGVGAGGASQLLSDDREQYGIFCEAILEVCEIIGAEDLVLVAHEEAGWSIVPTYEDHCYVVPVDQCPIPGRKPEGRKNPGDRGRFLLGR